MFTFSLFRNIIFHWGEGSNYTLQTTLLLNVEINDNNEHHAADVERVISQSDMGDDINVNAAWIVSSSEEEDPEDVSAPPTPDTHFRRGHDWHNFHSARARFGEK